MRTAYDPRWDAFWKKSLDRNPPEYSKILHKVLQGEDNRDRNQNLNRMPLTHKIEHHEGMVQETHPNPQILARLNLRRWRMTGEESGTNLAQRKKRRSPGSRNFDGGGDSRARAQALAENKRRKETAARHTRARALSARTGSPDAFYVAPDVSGDHRTHAQRRMDFGIAPDDGHRTLALASGASDHVR